MPENFTPNELKAIPAVLSQPRFATYLKAANGNDSSRDAPLSLERDDLCRVPISAPHIRDLRKKRRGKPN
jgi:hypothetical protein